MRNSNDLKFSAKNFDTDLSYNSNWYLSMDYAKIKILSWLCVLLRFEALKMTLGTLNKRMIKSRERNGQQEDFHSNRIRTGSISIAWLLWRYHWTHISHYLSKLMSCEYPSLYSTFLRLNPMIPPFVFVSVVTVCSMVWSILAPPYYFICLSVNCLIEDNYDIFVT